MVSGLDIGKISKLDVYTLLEDYAGYDTSFYAQHGVSFLIDATSDNGVRNRILMDVGQCSEPVLSNMELLGLDPKSIDIIVLSHCHYDHVGGLIGVLKAIGKEVPIVAHEDIFRPHLVVEPMLKHVGIGKDIIKEAEENGGYWILTREPLKLMRGITTTGEIPEEERETFERGTVKGLYTIGKKGLVIDNLLDDISLVVNTLEGLVVISGCSHAGIVSIVKRSVNLTGDQKIRAVIGGFHLISAEEDRIFKVIESLKNMKVGKIYTGHCTGLDAECIFRREFGSGFEKLNCGKIIRF